MNKNDYKPEIDERPIIGVTTEGEPLYDEQESRQSQTLNSVWYA